MITQTLQRQHIPEWQQELSNGISSPKELCRLLGLELPADQLSELACRQFRQRVPRSFAARMQFSNANDPLLRQVLPDAREMQKTPGYTNDPVGDLAAMPVPGLLHKYQGRVLLVATGACAIHCRYCFRRHFPYSDANPSKSDWQHALEYIGNDDSIIEVILSGGDPLTLSDKRLRQLSEYLQNIPHLKRLRIHTRLPVVLPSRVDSLLLQWLNACCLEKIIVIHANHANEIDDDVASAMGRLSVAGCRLFNQAVLLRDINDTVQSQVDLAERLFSVGIQPYYLHMLDKVEGAAHFEVSVERARQLMSNLTATLPGYMLPRLVTEIAGETAKTPVFHTRDVQN